VYDERSDESLMADYAAGSADAFDELFRRYEPIACAWFRRRVASEDRAWDLYQELFLRLHRARHTYDPSRPFRPWFFQVARSVLIDDVRRAFRARELPLDETSSAATAGDAEREVAAREEATQQLGRLSAESAHVVVGSLVLGRGYGDLAAEIGKSRDAVKQIASRALRKLRTGWTPG
jgi:RNA polymerase sigma-70 factor (ECF subfamily)